jgi:hypothetical protein
VNTETQFEEIRVAVQNGREDDVIVSAPGEHDNFSSMVVRRALPPKPALPTTDGSIVAQPEMDDPDRNPVSAFMRDGNWYSTQEGFGRLWPEHWASGWKLIHEAPYQPTHDELAEVIWEASRRDEGTISATGANIVADRVLELYERGE